MMQDRVEPISGECAHAGELCGPAVKAANNYIDQEEERLARSHQWKITKAIYTERRRSLALCAINAISTVMVLLVASMLLVEYSYDFRGYFAIGGEYVAIALVGGLMPLVLFWIEQKWMDEDD